MQSIRIMSRPPSRRKRKRRQINQFRWTSTKVIPIQKTWAVCISTMSQGFKRGSKLRTNSPTCLFLVAYLSIQVATRSISADITVFHAWAYGRFVEIQSTVRRKKLHRTNQGTNFFEAVSAIEMSVPQSNIKEKVNSSILKGDFSSRTNPSNFTSIAPVLLEGKM